MIEREALAIGWAVEYFKYYLWGRQFTVIMDHAPLQWLNHWSAGPGEEMEAETGTAYSSIWLLT